MKIKEVVYGLLDEERGNQRGDNLVHYLISGLIILNVFALFLESYKELEATYGSIFKSIEIVSIIVFSIEYAARIWTADLAFKNKGVLSSRWSYIFSFMGLIDLLSILPFYLPFLFKMDLRVIRTLRLLRLLRILKLNRHSEALRLITTVFRKSKNDIVATIFIVSILLVIAATLMYDIENKAHRRSTVVVCCDFNYGRLWRYLSHNRLRKIFEWYHCIVRYRNRGAPYWNHKFCLYRRSTE
jgi:voltage-gated potassium channel